MSILGTEEKTPEEEVVEEEKVIVEQLKKVDEQLEQVLEYEEKLLSGLNPEERSRVNENKLKQNLKDIQITLEEDIEEEETTLAEEIKNLKQKEEEIARSGNLSAEHGEMLDILGQVVNELEEERLRLEDLAQTGMQYIMVDEIDYEEAAQELSKHTRADEEEALDLQNRIHKAEELENKIIEKDS